MPTYTEADLEQIAAAVAGDIGQVLKHKRQFEAAALWFRLGKRRPHRRATSKLRARLDSIAKNARRLLTSLGIKNAEEAFDGPNDSEILEALVLMDERNEDAIIESTRKIGRLTEILEGIAAVSELERRATEATNEVTEVGNLIVSKGNSGDAILNGWIGAMMGLYRTITGKNPGTSVGGPEQPDEGIARGPLIRFLEAAGKPLHIEYSEDAWRSRVRTILKDTPLQD